jgi:hypothetical protein
MKDLIVDEKLYWNDIRLFVPNDIKNTWIPSGNLEHGFKYEWTDSNHIQNHIHGHSADKFSVVNSNSANGWTVSMRNGNRWFKKDGNTTRNTSLFANEMHIPLII